MKVVSNSGPIIAFAKLGLIQVLNELYSTVVIPSPVYREVVIKGLQKGEDDAKDIRIAVDLGRLKVEYINENELSEEIKDTPLHIGEKAVIQYMLNSRTELGLLDDKIAREIAKKLGFKVKGTLGIVVEAYRKEILSERDTEFLFKEINSRDEIWIAKDLVDNVWHNLRKELKR
jgi:predicted nucleic acid-binding protein